MYICMSTSSSSQRLASVCIHIQQKKIERELSSFASYSICSRREESAYSCIWTYAYRWCILSYSSFLLLQHTRMLIAVGVHIEKKIKTRVILPWQWVNKWRVPPLCFFDWLNANVYVYMHIYSTRESRFMLSSSSSSFLFYIWIHTDMRKENEKRLLNRCVHHILLTR